MMVINYITVLQVAVDGSMLSKVFSDMLLTYSTVV